MMDQRKRFSRGGNSGAWIFLLLLAVVGVLLWSRGSREEALDFSSIIPSQTAANNTPGPISTGTQTQNSRLSLEGFTLYGVQTGHFSTPEAAESAGGVLWQEDGYRTLRSLWTERAQAEQAAEEQDYVTALSIPGLKLQLSGRQEDLDQVQQTLDVWKTVLIQAAELQVCRESLSPETRQEWQNRLIRSLHQQAEALPDQEALEPIRQALETSAALPTEDLQFWVASLYACYRRLCLSLTQGA